MSEHESKIIGKLTITIAEDMSLELITQGAMENAPFLSVASDYLIKYKDRVWESTWVDERKKDIV